MSDQIKSALKTGFKVAIHWIVAILIVGVVELLNNSKVFNQLTQALINFGIPTALTNVVLASIVKFLTTEEAQIVNP